MAADTANTLRNFSVQDASLKQIRYRLANALSRPQLRNQKKQYLFLNYIDKEMPCFLISPTRGSESIKSRE
jgi:hypothetical protein